MEFMLNINNSAMKNTDKIIEELIDSSGKCCEDSKIVQINDRNLSIKKESFILYNSTRELVEDLEADDFKSVILAIFDYNIDGRIPKGLGTAANIAFKAIKIYLDRNNELYIKRSESGKKGGAPIGNKNACKSSKQKQDLSRKSNSVGLAVTKNPHGDLISICKELIKQFNFICGKTYGDLPVIVDNERILLLDNVICSINEKYPDMDYKIMFQEIFQRMIDSRYLSGTNKGSKWKAGFDWVLKSNNWEKVYMGKLN